MRDDGVAPLAGVLADLDDLGVSVNGDALPPVVLVVTPLGAEGALVAGFVDVRTDTFEGEGVPLACVVEDLVDGGVTTAGVDEDVDARTLFASFNLVLPDVLSLML